VAERYTPVRGRARLRGDNRRSDGIFAAVEDQHAVARRMEKNMRLAEFKCVEFVEELMYGHLRKPPNK
jgi:hypothetical protein